MTAYPQIRSFGDTAFSVEFGVGIDRDVNAMVMALHAALRDIKPAGLTETIPSFRALLVQYDPLATSRADLETQVRGLFAGLKPEQRAGRLWRLPVCYAPDLAPDLNEVAANCKVTPQQVIDIHTSGRYFVYMLGFMPGLAYMGGLDAKLHLPRRKEPRTKVPQSSVAIAESMTTIYPWESPGGWHLIGRTPLRPFDAAREEPILLAAGDEVTYAAISSDDYAAMLRQVEQGAFDYKKAAGDSVSATGSLDIVSPGLVTAVQDLGRRGAQALGMPVAGATDPLALRLVNRLVGNEENTGALEIGFLGPSFTVNADAVRIAFGGVAKLTLQSADGSDARSLKPWRSALLKRGDRLAIGAVEEGGVAYLAVAGGFAIPLFMGSQSTYMRSGLGGFEGRALKAGDKLPIAKIAEEADERELADLPDYGSGPVRVVLGPQDDRFTETGIKTFLSATYTVTKEADRMGIRLDGETIEHTRGADIESEGVVGGSIQVPGNGKPIILMADRQTTGGYTKIATVISADLPRVGRMKPGDTLTFTAISVAEAEAIRRAQEQALKRLIEGIRTALPDVYLDLNALYTQNLISGAVDAPSGHWR